MCKDGERGGWPPVCRRHEERCGLLSSVRLLCDTAAPCWKRLNLLFGTSRRRPVQTDRRRSLSKREPLKHLRSGAVERPRGTDRPAGSSRPPPGPIGRRRGAATVCKRGRTPRSSADERTASAPTRTPARAAGNDPSREADRAAAFYSRRGNFPVARGSLVVPGRSQVSLRHHQRLAGAQDGAAHVHGLALPHGEGVPLPESRRSLTRQC